MKASKTLLQRKYARVISDFAKKAQISNQDALELFYHSEIYKEMKNGISDMHCRAMPIYQMN